MNNRRDSDTVAVDFLELLKEHNKGRTAFDMSKHINDVITAIRETGKKSGSVTLKMSFRTIDGDIDKIFVSDEITVKKPLPDRKGSLFFSTDEGGLQRTDPRQTEMSFMKKGDEHSESEAA